MKVERGGPTVVELLMLPRWRLGATYAMIALSCAFIAHLLSTLSFFQILNLKVVDGQFVLRGQQSTSNIVLLVVDQKALDTFHDLRVFWHPYYAQAIRAAGEGGARVIGLDLAFGVPVDKWQPDYDRLLAEAVSTSPVPVVCGYAASLNDMQRVLPVPINMIAAALGLSAFANLTADPDDFVRRQELIEAPSPNPDDPPPARSLAFRVAEKALGEDAVFANGRLTLAGHAIPISSERSIQINYAGPPGTFPRVSLADFIAAAKSGNKEQLRKWVEGKIVLVGADNPVEDRFPTPFFTPFSGKHWNTAGVEIHANTVRTVLQRSYLTKMPDWGQMVSVFLVSAITVIAMTNLAGNRAAVALLLGAFGVLGLSHLFFLAHIIVTPVEMLIAAALCGLGSTVYRVATAEQRGQLYGKAIALFVGQRFAKNLERSQDIGLTGKRQTVTILFTDIRGFTAFTEKASEEAGGPETVVQLLNEYMSMMVSIIVAYGGQVNKFLGDGILAVFSDDDPNAAPGDHATRAAKCAARMVMAPSRFATGAGIHTGDVVIGNVGSADKMEYTVLGDTVNLASRLESLNKEHHTRLLISEATRTLLGDDIETMPIGEVAVRGKSAPINLYTLTSTLTPREVSTAHNA